MRARPGRAPQEPTLTPRLGGRREARAQSGKRRQGEGSMRAGRQEHGHHGMRVLGDEPPHPLGTGRSGRGLAFLLGAWGGCPVEQEMVELFLEEPRPL